MASRTLEHPEIQKLAQFGVAAAQVEPFDVLFLPENLMNVSRRQDLLDSEDSIDLAKRLKEEGIACATSYDLTPEAAIVQRGGGDLWLGTIWIMRPEAVNRTANVLSRKLKSWLRRNDGRGMVHLQVRIRGETGVAEFGYVGDGLTLRSLLRGLQAGEKRM